MGFPSALIACATRDPRRGESNRVPGRSLATTGPGAVAPPRESPRGYRWRGGGSLTLDHDGQVPGGTASSPPEALEVVEGVRTDSVTT